MITIKEKLAPAWFDVEGVGYLLAPLSKYDAIDFRNEITLKKGKVSVSGEGIRIAGNAVRDWRNVCNEKGEPIPFIRTAYDELPIEHLIAIAGEVFRRSFLSEIERKKSSSPSTSG